MNEPPTPELNRVQAIHDKSQACGEFLEWLTSKGWHLGRYHEHTDECYVEGKRSPQCGMLDGQLYGESYSIEKLLAEFFEIDLPKCHQERAALLNYIRHIAADPRG